MDAKRFLSEYQRMCGYYSTHKEKGCGSCPLNLIDCALYSDNPDLDEIIDLVEKWANEHKKVTRLDLFKQWLVEQGADPEDVSEEELDVMIIKDCGFLKCSHIMCSKCKYNNFWTKEVERE